METTTAQIEEAEEGIGELEDKVMEKEAEKKRDEKIQDHKGRIGELNDAIKHNTIRIIVIPEEEEREKS